MDIAIVLGSSGLLGRVVTDHLMKQNIVVISVDKNALKLDENNNQYIFDISNLNSQNDFNEFFDYLLKGYSNFNLSLIDCLLLRSKNNKETIQEIHNSLYGYLTTSITLAKWFGKYCLTNDLNASMIMLSSVKGFYAPKFYHYENTNMNSDVEYGISKAGISYAAKDLSVRFKGNVKYNCVAPAGIEGENHSKVFLKKYDQSCLIKPGLVKPVEIAKLIHMLISPTCPIIGQTIIIDNGWSLT